ncbi:uncharacterized protein N7484_000742 [Penicillium longicatenatum]|uniref:uncharacterized protein n=1 Tax=Penicillium longicatenatum TaxID=1561947 RepID=UPI002547649D|nr:uncharacterized protein N7484_000742 [Penicillium longicatenatum]KAJ5661370.1 hypothetical protein N7484_000742 [Penicillium longicatenatum]
MAVPGIVMRLSETPERPVSPFPDVEATYILRANDGGAPSFNTVYFLSDITPVLSTPEYYNTDLSTHNAESASLSWKVCAYINGRDRFNGTNSSEPTPHVQLKAPVAGSIMVANGSTPRADKEQDYHDWYDHEHGEKLTLVPGWNAARRYGLVKVYGEVETAKFYGLNFYDKVNGLGGPEWKAGVTEWTLRIRSNAAKPNIRRVWKFETPDMV